MESFLSFLFTLLRSASNIIGGGSLLVIICYMVDMIRNKKAVSIRRFLADNRLLSSKTASKVYVVLLSVGIISSMLANSSFQHFFGFYNLAFADEGKHCYYVSLISEDDKEYRVPGEIEVITEKDEDDDGTSVVSRRYRYYYLNKIVFKNGRSLEFEADESLNFEDENFIYDEKGRMWSCWLSNEHAYSKQIKESSEIPSFIFLLLKATGISSLLITMIYDVHKRSDE